VQGTKSRGVTSRTGRSGSCFDLGTAAPPGLGLCGPHRPLVGSSNLPPATSEIKRCRGRIAICAHGARGLPWISAGGVPKSAPQCKGIRNVVQGASFLWAAGALYVGAAVRDSRIVPTPIWLFCRRARRLSAPHRLGAGIGRDVGGGGAHDVKTSARRGCAVVCER
jgi:hypothetical protein